MDAIPVRGSAVRELSLAIPPARMAPWRRGRPLKRWRYVGVFGPELMLCAATVRIGPLRQRFWAIAEPGRPLRERTTMRAGGVSLDGSRVLVRSAGVEIDIALEEDDGIECVCPSGPSGYAWTRKQAGVAATGSIRIDGREASVDARAVVDDSAGYHARRTAWRWCAGIGRSERGERIGWNLVAGVNDPPRGSERAIWGDGLPSEPAPVRFAEDLSSVSFSEGGRLDFTEWSAREDETDLVVFRSSYRQPFGSFAGTLPGGVRLAAGWGVMERHEALW